MGCGKYRIRFRKAEDLRLVSHHDLLRCFERMLRRAAVPFRCTAGFNPKPRMVFALSLGLGIVGCEEVVDLELTEELAAEEVERRLRHEAPAGLDLLSVRRIDPRATAQVSWVRYRVAVPPERLASTSTRIQELLDAPACWIERSRPQPRRLDIRPYLRDVCLSHAYLQMDFWVTPQGTARPDEVLTLVGLEDLLAGGVIVERTLLELHDESADRGLSAAKPPAVEDSCTP